MIKIKLCKVFFFRIEIIGIVLANEKFFDTENYNIIIQIPVLFR